MQLSYESYHDKVRGGWIGKCAGGILGAPIEGFKRFNSITIDDRLFETNFPNDDLDLQVLWLDMVCRKGVHLSEKDFADHWIKHVGFPWNEYGIATRNLRAGLLPPESGRINNSYWMHSMGCPIRSEIWGMLCAGQPEQAARYAAMDASLDHAGFSLHAEQYLSVCASLAFIMNDVADVLEEALKYIPSNSEMAKMVLQVMQWYQLYSFEVTAGKIKSYYGDADFTAAPMNIAFTILTLLNSNNDFSCIAQALHMGHDSDCIVATAGALIGIIKGYEALPEIWKTRVGDELLISDAIVGIYKPNSIVELTEITCREGIRFQKHFNYAAPISNTVAYEFKYELPEWSDNEWLPMQILFIRYRNTTTEPQKVTFRPLGEAIKFLTKPESQLVLPNQEKAFVYSVECYPPKSNEIIVATNVEVNIDDDKAGEENIVLPYFGSWLLIGPFIQDDPLLEPCDPTYPDHGSSGLPSVQYMNHDMVGSNTSFLSYQQIRTMLKDGVLDQQPFYSSIIHCSSFRIPFKQFKGKGERTVYLYSYLQLDKVQQLWLSFGTTAKLKMYVNGKEVAAFSEIKRSWPGAFTVLHEFGKGINDICIRLDCVVDETVLEFGIKEFTGLHPHQTQWSLLTPFFETSCEQRHQFQQLNQNIKEPLY